MVKDVPLLNQLYGSLSLEEACYELKKNVAGINIAYDSLDFMHIEEDPKIEVFALVGNIGGTLGIYLNAFELYLFRTTIYFQFYDFF
jgi:hypothetical protein